MIYINYLWISIGVPILAIYLIYLRILATKYLFSASSSLPICFRAHSTAVNPDCIPNAILLLIPKISVFKL